MTSRQASAVSARATATTTCVPNNPNQCTNRGVKNADSAVPTMPAPKTPSRSRAGRVHTSCWRTDADRENRARDAEEEPAHQQQRVGTDRSREPHRQHRQDRGQGDSDEHDATTEPVGERTDHDPAQRPDQYRRRNQHRPLGAGQRQIPGVGGGQRADHVPGPEIDGGDPSGQRQVHTLPCAGSWPRRRVHVYYRTTSTGGRAPLQPKALRRNVQRSLSSYLYDAHRAGRSS